MSRRALFLKRDNAAVIPVLAGDFAMHSSGRELFPDGKPVVRQRNPRCGLTLAGANPAGSRRLGLVVYSDQVALWIPRQA